MRIVSSSSLAITATFPTLFLGLAASAQLIAFFIYFGGKPDWIVVTLFCILTSGTYLLNRVSDKEDKFNNILRWRFFNETPMKTTIWMGISILTLIIPIIVLISMNKYDTALQFATLSIIGFIYTIKIIPIIKDKKLNWINIKEIPLGKTLVVCSIWSGSAIVIASSIMNISIFRSDLLLLFISIFIGSCNNAITTDARDIPGDQMRNIKTIPSIFGLKNTFKLLSYFSITGILLICACLLTGLVDIRIALFSMLIIIWTYLCILPHYHSSFTIPKTAGELLLDSYLIVIASGLVILGILK